MGYMQGVVTSRAGRQTPYSRNSNSSMSIHLDVSVCLSVLGMYSVESGVCACVGRFHSSNNYVAVDEACNILYFMLFMHILTICLFSLITVL